MVKNVEGFPTKKTEDWGITPCDIIFNYVEKPQDYIGCKSINVFDNRWRINIYSKRMVEGIEGRIISKSYFVHMNNNKLTIVSP